MTIRNRSGALLLAGALLAAGGVFAAQAAFALPSPNHGPTTGGTTVTDEIPGFVFTQTASGGAFSLGLDDYGNAYAWGSNADGELGNDSTFDSPYPRPVMMPTGVSFTKIVAVYTSAFALGTDGTWYAWGYNASGQLGIGSTDNALVPTPVVTPTGVSFTTIAPQYDATIALGSDGKAYGWGDNSLNQLGNGGTANALTATPVTMPTGVTFTAAASGSSHTIALGSDGKTYGWGYNAFGQLGDNSTAIGNVPTPVHTPSGVALTKVFAADQTSFGIGDDGITYAWGSNASGQLGDGTTTNHTTPTPTAVGLTFASIWGGSGFTYGETADGTLYAWGSNAYGQLGDGTTNPHLSPVALTIPDATSVSEVSAGHLHGAAIRADGTIYTWGWNAAGQLGDGTTVDKHAPEPLLPELVSIEFGSAAGVSPTLTDNTWTAVTPAGCGVQDVTVTYTRFGQERSISTPGGFTYGTVPSVTTQPAGVTIEPGGTTTLTAAADGDDSPTTRWQSSSTATGPWADVPGATATGLSVAPKESTYYRAVFTNCRGEATTDAALVTVQTSPGPSPSPSPTPTGSPTAPPTPGGGHGGTGAGSLAETGSDSPALWGLGAVGLLLAGAWALTVRRRNTTV